MNDRQIGQLSGWVKSRVKKFNTFDSALKGFRAFITTAALDKSLVSQSMLLHAREPAPDIERFRRREQADKAKEEVFTRQIEIHESALEGSGEDNTFINPSFLMTQSQSAAPSSSGASHQAARSQSLSAQTDTATARDSESDLLKLFRRGVTPSSITTSGGPANGVTAAAPAGLLDAFSRSREKNSMPQTPGDSPSTSERVGSQVDRPFTPLTISYSGSSSSSSQRPSSALLASKPAPSSSTTAFGLGSTAKPTTFHVAEKIVRTKDSTIADYFTAPKPSTQGPAQTQGGITRPPPVVKKSGLDIPKFSQSVAVSGREPTLSQSGSGSHPQSFLKYLAKLDDETYDAPDPVTEFHSQIGE